MKKILFIAFLLLSFSLTSCNTNSDEINSLKATADEVVRCFNEDDVDALKLLFCKNTLNEALEIESQIKTSFDYYDGTSEVHTFSYLGFDGCRIEGEWIDKHSIVRIKDIRTSTGKTYWITYTEYITFDADSERIGIIGMSLRDENLNVIAEIG